MLIGLIGDTHGQTGAVLPALQHAREAGADLVVLMGGVGWWQRRAAVDFFVRCSGHSAPLGSTLRVILPSGAAADIQRARVHLVREYARPWLHVHGHFHDERVHCRRFDDGRELRTIGLGADGRAAEYHDRETVLPDAFSGAVTPRSTPRSTPRWRDDQPDPAPDLGPVRSSLPAPRPRS